MPEPAKPVIVAEFVTDAAGNPLFIDEGGTKHYKLKIDVENAPEDAYAATFELDPTYYDPVQTLRPNPAGQFSLKTTSYGDYDLTVRLRTRAGDIPIADSLTRALQRSYRETPSNEALRAALTDIANK